MSPFGPVNDVKRDAYLIEEVVRDLTVAWDRLLETTITSLDAIEIETARGVLRHIAGPLGKVAAGMDDLLWRVAQERKAAS